MTGTQSHLVHDDRDAEPGLLSLVCVVVVVIASSVDDDQKAKQISFFFFFFLYFVFFCFLFQQLLVKSLQMQVVLSATVR